MPNVTTGMEKYDELLENMNLADPLSTYIDDRREAVTTILYS